VELPGPPCSDVSQGRGELASLWLRDSRTEWSLWIDDDIEIPWHTLCAFIERAMSTTYDLICCQYVGKQPGSGLLTARFAENPVIMGHGGGYAEVLGCGFGCVLARHTLFDRISEHLPLVRWDRSGAIGRPYFLGMVIVDANDPEGPRVQIGEDYAFCYRARAVGGKLACDTTVRVWHHGDYGYGWEDADATLERYASIRVENRTMLSGGFRAPRITDADDVAVPLQENPLTEMRRIWDGCRTSSQPTPEIRALLGLPPEGAK
jgi:hypothetical protein